ncbi:MAG TPA: PDZ domain-containing protein [Thiothrix sp.]|nr:PDZ domain-containing protein [Thiothrix sp.]
MFNQVDVESPLFFSRCIVIVMLVFLTACATTKNIPKPLVPVATNEVEQVILGPEDRVITVLDLQTVKGLEAIAPRLSTYRAVLVGENHIAYGDHLNQVAIIKSLHKRWKGMAIGLEFVQQPFQKALDEYVACRLSEFDMLQQTQWYKRWKYDFRLYRPIFEFAREQKIPLIALNIPTELTKRISKVGLDGLTARQRQQLPKTIDKSNEAYAKHLKNVFNLHARVAHVHSSKKGKGNKQANKRVNKHSTHSANKSFDRFYEAQLAWDEGMAATAAAYLLKHPTAKMVILAGGGHLINRHGIPARLERRIRSKVAVVLNDAGEQPAASNGDFLLLSPAAKLPKAGLLGILMRQENAGVVISTIIPNGAAKKAGLKEGDILLTIAENKVKEMGDVKLLLLDAKPAEEKTVSILRDNKKLQKTLILQ